MKTELTPEESKTYMLIVQKGNMDDMFDFAYAIGREKCLQEQIEEMKKL